MDEAQVLLAPAHRSIWSCEFSSVSTCSTSGSSARMALSSAGRPRYNMEPTKPMRSRPRRPASTRCTSVRTSSACRNSVRASRYSTCPASVSSTWRLLRFNRRVPTLSSSCRMA